MAVAEARLCEVPTARISHISSHWIQNFPIQMSEVTQVILPCLRTWVQSHVSSVYPADHILLDPPSVLPNSPAAVAEEEWGPPVGRPLPSMSRHSGRAMRPPTALEERGTPGSPRRSRAGCLGTGPTQM